jgi:hypothetical protein
MRLPGSEKLEIIRIVEQSHLPARREVNSHIDAFTMVAAGVQAAALLVIPRPLLACYWRER